MYHSENQLDLISRLLEKSIEGYCLALETINRLTIQYRLEAFCYLFCNSWELLLKAKILAESGDERSIYYKSQRNNKRSLSLRDCLRQVFTNPTDPTRRNIERIEKLRDESVHLVINRIPHDVIRIFQAGVVNYHRSLNQWFGESLSQRFPVGMMSIVYDLSPENSDLSNARLQRELGLDASEFLTRYCADVKKEFEELNFSAEFSIGIQYRLVLTNRVDDGDIVLTSGSQGAEYPTQIVEVAKDSGSSHPFRQKELLEHLNERLPTTVVNSHDIKCINKVYGIKSKPEFFYQGRVPGSPAQYSPAFEDWVVTRFMSDNRFFTITRDKFKSMPG